MTRTRPGALGLVTAVALAASALLAAGPGVDFPFDRLYGTYEDLEIETAPANDGALDVRLSSPENSLTLERGSLRLDPAADGLHKAALDVTFSGEGLLVTELKIGSIPSRFEDQVRFPRQTHRLTAWVTIEPVEDGYEVVAEELPETVTVEVESSRAQGLVDLCRKMSLFLPGDAGCENLESLLSSPRVPLPRPGSAFLVRRESLTEAERERLDLYLAGSRL